MLRNRWTVLSVLVLLLMALPQSVCLADIGILNGDFALWVDSQSPVDWVRDAESPGVLSRTTDEYHVAPPSAKLAGGLDAIYYQCVDTSTWSGSIEIGGWVYGPSFYDPTTGRIDVTWYGEADCSGEGTTSTLDLVTNDFWSHVSTVFNVPSVHPDTYVSMRVTLFAKANEGAHFDDIYATSSPTAVGFGSVSASAATLPTAMLLGLAAGASAIGWVRRRRG